MATFSSRMSDDTTVEGASGEHLRRLVSWWGLLADLSFADLLLWAPAREPDGEFVLIGHMRPSTSMTIYDDDVVGLAVSEVQRPLISRAMRDGEIVEGEVTLPGSGNRARVACVPVRHEGRVVAVLTQEWSPSQRRKSELETVYLQVFRRLAVMITEGRFPQEADETDMEEAPRVGDGVMVFDRDRVLSYASPNATSTLHRLGVAGPAKGIPLTSLGGERAVIRRAFEHQVPVNTEIERGDDHIVDVLAVPLVERGQTVGALVIVRDVSELRRRDRELISKDATIREIHHRVKNNLQTISSLLRLQARRLESPEARLVIEESVRRIASIALVHETLSHEATLDVPLQGVVNDLARMFADSVRAPERPLRTRITGDPGIVPAELVTPIAVVLNELLQNAVDHSGEREVDIEIDLARRGDELSLSVADRGPGLPEGFDADRAEGLGMSIVRALVRSDLGGRFEMLDRPDPPGSVARVVVPIRAAR